MMVVEKGLLNESRADFEAILTDQLAKLTDYARRVSEIEWHVEKLNAEERQHYGVKKDSQLRTFTAIASFLIPEGRDAS
jgi:hypothetical protein